MLGWLGERKLHKMKTSILTSYFPTALNLRMNKQDSKRFGKQEFQFKILYSQFVALRATEVCRPTDKSVKVLFLFSHQPVLKL